MKRIFVSTIILVIFMFPFSMVVKAETEMVYDLVDFKDYDSFQKRYYEHASELIYYAGVSYDSNDHYFKENMDLYRQAVNETFDNTLINNTLNTLLDGMEYFRKPISFLLAADDLRERLFSKIKGYFSEPDYGAIVADSNNDRATIYPPNGYYYQTPSGNLYTYIQLTYNNYTWETSLLMKGVSQDYSSPNKVSLPSDLKIKIMNQENTIDRHSFFVGYYMFPDAVPLTLVPITGGDSQPIYTVNSPPAITNIYNRIVNGLDESQKFNEDYTPSVTPQLICPDFVVDLSYSDSSFYTKQRQAIVLDSDETTQYNGVTCNLDFKFPVLEYDELTGGILADGESLLKVPVVPENDYDTGILEYVRNSYNYSTSVINSGVNGLKSIATGTASLVTFSGTLFGFLPPELLTLFIGGFSVALGLWVFKK